MSVNEDQIEAYETYFALSIAFDWLRSVVVWFDGYRRGVELGFWEGIQGPDFGLASKCCGAIVAHRKDDPTERCSLCDEVVS